MAWKGHLWLLKAPIFGVVRVIGEEVDRGAAREMNVVASKFGIYRI